MSDDFPELPTFLRRGHPDCILDKPAKLIFESPPCAGHSRPLAAPTEEETTAMTKKPAAKKAAKKAASKKSATVKASIPAKAKTDAPKGVRPGSKLETVVNLLKRKKGCTMAEALAATDWPAISFNQQAKAAGIELRKVKEGKITRYFAA